MDNVVNLNLPAARLATHLALPPEFRYYTTIFQRP